VLAYGPTEETFTKDNLEKTFGGVLRHFVLNGSDGGKPWPVGVMTDDERPLVLRDGRPVSGQSVTSEGADNDERPR